MTFPELNSKFQKVINNLNNNYNGEIMSRVGIDALTMIKRRVQQTGVNAKGQKFPAYSTKNTLIGCSTFVLKRTCDNVFGSKEKRKALEWRTVNSHHLAILPGGYKKIRELQGRQGSYVDFTITGRMWANINLISNNGDHSRGVAIIGAKDEEEKKKLAGNTSRKGDILDLSVKEIEDLKAVYNLSVLNVFKQNGL